MSNIMVPMDNPGNAERVNPSKLAFASVWQILGPFQIGTREAPWGADPLEYYGGFRNLEFDRNASFRSSLTPNATVAWSYLDAASVSQDSSSAKSSLIVDFPHVDWKFLQSIYGWSALQYQAWARGEIIVRGDKVQDVVLYTDLILEFWLDGVRYFGGDMYGFRKAPPVLHLTPGSHRLDLRLVRDVRAMSGVGEPTIPVKVALEPCRGPLQVASDVLMPDVVDGKLAGSFGSVAVRNNLLVPISVHSIRSSDNEWGIVLNEDEPIVLAPGQTRPVTFILTLEAATPPPLLRMEIHHDLIDTVAYTLAFRKIVERKFSEPHRITFKHPAGIVSYAILRPPPEKPSYANVDSAPILLQMHGAGLEADSELVAHALDSVQDLCAWVIFPTGVTPWSGDDWHSWGFADVEAAISSIPSWIRSSGWQGIGVDTDRWFVSGHSNGGQGTWHVMTHRPDKVIAAAPVSGYLSTERYVPYEFWRPMDPRRQAIIRASINTYRHEMLAENCQGIPILEQHGTADDNVPAYHSRLMAQMLSQASAGSDYFEVPDAGHWWDGVMTTDSLKDFYRRHVPQGNATAKSLQRFTIVVANPGDMGSKGGITVTQLETPDQYGRMDTSNILSFRISPRICSATKVVVDGEAFTQGEITVDSEYALFTLTTEGSWNVSNSSHAVTQKPVGIRTGRQLGAMDAILRSHGKFSIMHTNKDTFPTALQISRNLYQYFSADSRIQEMSAMPVKSEAGNSIVVAVGVTRAGTLEITDSSGRRKEYNTDSNVAAIFLRPASDGSGGEERLELVVWAATAETLALVARLVPTITGVGQPDFVVLEPSSQWKGVEGAVAMGFFDHMWQVTATSFLGN
ncbi:hypothetical protein K490DRAFT_75704 [Saccharata proteae CBS 121410]|uniref:Peptidase S9 prolyl oligopeptidase catalytic domain-containing protein n=1 Tax=Saccharata proteae CBS 121410 TaxID=1314787 RepID=A0A9P4HQF2_9PEZI|nr:hypothetical protein K490DRAFT_75704 [Saccharata proteae CBS 121410]